MRACGRDIEALNRDHRARDRRRCERGGEMSSYKKKNKLGARASTWRESLRIETRRAGAATFAIAVVRIAVHLHSRCQAASLVSASAFAGASLERNCARED